MAYRFLCIHPTKAFVLSFFSALLCYTRHVLFHSPILRLYKAPGCAYLFVEEKDDNGKQAPLPQSSRRPPKTHSRDK